MLLFLYLFFLILLEAAKKLVEDVWNNNQTTVSIETIKKYIDMQLSNKQKKED